VEVAVVVIVEIVEIFVNTVLDIFMIRIVLLIYKIHNSAAHDRKRHIAHQACYLINTSKKYEFRK